MLDNLNLTHMNGRVYDQITGRFLSADPFVQDPFNGQSLNRYSYVFNNPLRFIDPSGFQGTEADGGSVSDPFFTIGFGFGSSYNPSEKLKHPNARSTAPARGIVASQNSASAVDGFPGLPTGLNEFFLGFSRGLDGNPTPGDFSLSFRVGQTLAFIAAADPSQSTGVPRTGGGTKSQFGGKLSKSVPSSGASVGRRTGGNPSGGDEGDPNIVFRVIRPDENPASGLFPKNPAETRYTVEGFVLNGSRPGFASRFIATTREFNVALAYSIKTGNRIVASISRKSRAA